MIALQYELDAARQIVMERWARQRFPVGHKYHRVMRDGNLMRFKSESEYYAFRARRNPWNWQPRATDEP